MKCESRWKLCQSCKVSLWDLNEEENEVFLKDKKGNVWHFFRPYERNDWFFSMRGADLLFYTLLRVEE